MADQDYFVHESSYVDAGVEIGKGTKIWHFSHVQSGSVIGEECILGQNVNIGNNVIIGNKCKVQNNVSIYEGVELEDYVFCGPSMVFTNIKLPRSEFPQKGKKFYQKTLVKKISFNRSKCYNYMRSNSWEIFLNRFRGSDYKTCFFPFTYRW